MDEMVEVLDGGFYNHKPSMPSCNPNPELTAATGEPWGDIAEFLFDMSVQQCQITVDYLQKAGYEVVFKIRGPNVKVNTAMTTNPAVRRLINKFERFPFFYVPEWTYRIYFRKASGTCILSDEHISIIEDGKVLDTTHMDRGPFINPCPHTQTSSPPLYVSFRID